MIQERVRGILFWWQHVRDDPRLNDIFDTLRSRWYTLPLLIFVTYFVCSLSIHGPAYLSDEVGYLAKAATIAGSPVHFTTSWFGGYSLMISPAFLLSANPFVEWRIIMALNALMWAGTAMLLRYVLRSTHPHARPQMIWLATLGAMAYPSWLSMSSYAFSTSGFVLVFMAALAAIIKSNLTQRSWLIGAAALVGYLCWIHPLGFLLLGLFGLLIIFEAAVQKRWRLLFVAGLGVAVAISYPLVMEPWLSHLMGGSIDNDSHYIIGLQTLIHAIVTVPYWTRVLELIAGLSFYAIVATMGFAVHGAVPIFSQLLHSRKSWRVAAQDTRFMVMLLSLLLVIAVIIFTAITWDTSSLQRIDQWVYGRYTDMYILPLLGFGLLTRWRLRPAVYSALFVLFVGILLSLVTNPSNTLFIFNNKVNIQSLWPMHLASVVHANYYWLWGVLGATGVLLVGMLGRRFRGLRITMLVGVVLLAGLGNTLYHQTILNQHATVSSLYQYVRSHYGPTDCMGFTPATDSYERFSLYSYYLHGYNLTKMSQQQWQQEDCSGPYFTYALDAHTPDTVSVIGKETTTGLIVLTQHRSSVGTKQQTPLLFR